MPDTHLESTDHLGPIKSTDHLRGKAANHLRVSLSPLQD